MVSAESVHKQLKKINFDYSLWGRAEVKELPNIMIDHEEIYEAVNGMYDGGFALLVATNVRLLLVDKKPLNFLNVEDMRFDMINELDYSHRLVGARINISAGNKNLSFMSANQQRLRRAIGHVQRCMAESKKLQSDHAEDQKQHLAQINQQLQSYLLAQHQQQESLRRQLEAAQRGIKPVTDVKMEQVKPSPELSDFLFAQSLLKQANLNPTGEPAEQHPKEQAAIEATTIEQDGPVAALPAQATPDETSEPAPEPVSQAADTVPVPVIPPAPEPTPASPQMSELYADGMREIFGKRIPGAEAAAQTAAENEQKHPRIPKGFDVNPLHIAVAKLPMALRNKKFGRPSFHAHSQQGDFLREWRQAAPTPGAQ